MIRNPIGAPELPFARKEADLNLPNSITLGGTPLGAPIVGWVANHFGPRLSLALGAGAGFSAALVAAYVLARREEPSLASR